MSGHSLVRCVGEPLKRNVWQLLSVDFPFPGGTAGLAQGRSLGRNPS
jgi:hypothetical protein